MTPMNTGLGGGAGYGENSFKTSGVDIGTLGDGSISVDITSVFGPAGINFYSTNDTSSFINSNGLITFDGPNTGNVPSGMSSLAEPAIATAGITDGGTNDIDLSGSGNETAMLADESNDFGKGDPVGTYTCW